ncbi:MAG TPA: methyl-accepting chemotaxis protein [Magnetospirillum sp.]|nr:methyl-accepting chemotaxis protein [Magnetospirillum sp.]
MGFGAFFSRKDDGGGAFARFAYDNSAAAILMLNEREVIHCNNAAVRLLGAKSAADLIGRSPGDLSPEMQPDGKKTADKVRELIGEAIQKGVANFEWEHRRIDNGKPVPVSVSLTVTQMNGQPVILTTLQDIAELVATRASQRRTTMTMADDLEARVQRLVVGLGHTVNRLNESAVAMSANADQTQRQSAAVSTATEEATSNVQTVSSAGTELSASINEIANQVQATARIIEGAVSEAESANARVAGLADSAAKIGEIVQLIGDIASQTNLLALNATIESARAGEAGKGFAVVANEVKSLAGQTGRATEEISRQIAAIQSETRTAVDAISEIATTVRHINELAAAIAGAVQQQEAATAEIARNVEQASAGTREVALNIVGVAEAASQTGALAQQVNSEAAELRGHAATLEKEVADFLEHLRA